MTANLDLLALSAAIVQNTGKDLGQPSRIGPTANEGPHRRNGHVQLTVRQTCRSESVDSISEEHWRKNIAFKTEESLDITQGSDIDISIKSVQTPAKTNCAYERTTPEAQTESRIDSNDKDRTFVCGVCAASLRGDEIREHLMPPIDPGFYQCKLCWVVFGQKCALSLHRCDGAVRNSDRIHFSSRGRPLKRRFDYGIAGISSEEEELASVTLQLIDENQPPSTYKLQDSNEVVSSVERLEVSPADAAANPTTTREDTGNAATDTADEDAEGPAECEMDAAGGAPEELSCARCQITFVSRRNLLRHREFQHSHRRRYHCERCPAHFGRLDTLVSHSVQAHRQPRRYKCPICAHGFTQRRIVAYHVQRHTRRRQISTRGAAEQRWRPADGRGQPPAAAAAAAPGQPRPAAAAGEAAPQWRYVCEPCCVGFGTRRAYLRHGQTRHGQPAPQYGCELCPMTYSRIDALTRHTVAVHHLKKVHPCGRCTRLFTQRSIAQHHETGHDTERRRQTGARGNRHCEQCKQSFASCDQLSQHTCRRPVKPRQQSCVCDICGRQISCRQALLRHRLQHGGERPFACSVAGCGKSFVDETALRNHRATHVDGGGGAFLCDVCGRRFAVREYLVRHRRCHSGERPHTCGVCGRSFALALTLRRHMRIHTGEKPFQCRECGRRFRQAQQLKTHMKVHQKVARVQVLDADAVGGRVDHMVGGQEDHVVGGRVDHVVGGQVDHVVGGQEDHVVGGRVDHAVGGRMDHVVGGQMEHVVGELPTELL